MSTFWKVVIGLALVLPMSAYVVGSLLASTAGEPGPRDPIIIQDATTSPTSEPTTARPEPSRKPTPRAPRNRGGDDVDDNGVRIVTPEPTRVGGDDDDTGDDDSADDDDDRGDDDADDGGDD